MPDWENLRLYTGSPWDSGAYHGVEINMVIGNSEGVSGIKPSTDEVALTAIMQEAWTAFVADPADGLTSVAGWPKYLGDGKGETMILLGVNTSSIVQFVDPDLYDSVCSGLDLDFQNSSNT